MKTKQLLMVGFSLIGCCLFLANRRGYSKVVQNPLVRLAELEIFPDQLDAYRPR